MICPKCGEKWTPPKPKCPFCKKELPRPEFKPKDKKEEEEDSSSSSEDEGEEKKEEKKEEKEEKKDEKREKPKCPNCGKELPFFWGRHGHRHFRGCRRGGKKE